MLNKNKLLILFYLVTICYLFIEIMFSEKGIIKFANNTKLIQSKKDVLNESLKKKSEIENYLDNFQSNKEFRKLVIKDKLFFKDKVEKVILYRVIN